MDASLAILNLIALKLDFSQEAYPRSTDKSFSNERYRRIIYNRARILYFDTLTCLWGQYKTAYKEIGFVTYPSIRG